MTNEEVERAELAVAEADQRVDAAYSAWSVAQRDVIREFLTEQAATTVREQVDVTDSIQDLSALKRSVQEAIEACAERFFETYKLPPGAHATTSIGTQLDGPFRRDTPDVIGAFHDVFVDAGFRNGASKFAEQETWHFYAGRYREGKLPMPAPDVAAFDQAISSWAIAVKDRDALLAERAKQSAAARWDSA